MLENIVEDQRTAREDLRHARTLDRQEQKERIDELVPRAEAGTRERQIEKKRELNDKMKSFRDRSPGAVEVGEKDLMGDDGIDAYKAKKREHQRKKNDREIRKEEIVKVSCCDLLVFAICFADSTWIDFRHERRKGRKGCECIGSRKRRPLAC